MRTILVIGIGMGDPEQLTLQAIGALRRADVVFIPDKGAEKADLHTVRETICDRFLLASTRRITVAIPPRDEAGANYHGAVDRWHAALAAHYETLFRTELGDDGVGALLVWGDPSLYDSTLRLIERIRDQGLPLALEVVPGITSLQMLVARHAIPLNRIGEPVTITTGRRLVRDGPGDADTLVVMLDGEQAFRSLPAQDHDIWWGAYLGTPDEILIAGPLAEVRDEISARRTEARARKGWIMDTYLLRRRR